MTAPARKKSSFLTHSVVIAMAISLVIHLSGFGVWKLGTRYGWWTKKSVSSWIQRLTDKLLPAPDTKFVARNEPTPDEPTLIFTEVNPSLAAVRPPENAKYQGAVSTEAASPKQSEDPLPKIEGRQEEVLKVTEDAPPKAIPLQPTPKVATPEPVEAEAKPPEQNQEGETIFAKPSNDVQKNPGNKPSEGKAKETRRPPRTVAEAKKRSGTAGPQAKRDGGSKVLDLSSSMDVKGTPLGDYVADMVEAVKQRWYKELEEVSATTPGRVVIEFRLHSSGRVSNARVSESNVGELLSLICQKAIQDPSPYKPWPKELKRELNAEYKDVSFTFSYLHN